MKTFKFTCKQNQTNQVVLLLKQFTGKKPKIFISLENGFPVVTVNHHGSNRQINQFLFTNNVPGTNPKKNRYKIVKCDAWEFVYKVPVNTWVKWTTCYTNKLVVAKWQVKRTYCSCCDYQTEIVSKSGKVLN